MGMTALDDADPKREDIMTMLNTFKVIKEQINVSVIIMVSVLQIFDVVVMDIHVISIFTVPRIFERYPVT